VARLVRAVLACGALMGAAAPAAAQSPPASAHTGRVSFGADVSGVISPRDDTAFFNYTDVGYDAMRLGRIRLAGEWAIASRLALLGELRADVSHRAGASALYLRWRPWAGRVFDVQVGRIPPVVGAFSRRAYGKDNALIGQPLGYQYLTSLRADALPATIDDILRMRARGWRPSFPVGSTSIGIGLPLISASQWDTGVETHWSAGWWDLAGAWTRGAPAHPALRHAAGNLNWSGRAALRLPAGVSLGLSAARAQWVDASALRLAAGAPASSAAQTVLAVNAEYARGPWQLRGEWIHAGFHVPTFAASAPPLVARAAFGEASWRFLPRWYAALRLEHLGFSSVSGTLFGGAPTPWDAPVRRVEAAVGFRVATRLELRAGWQQNWRDAGHVRRLGIPALQVLWWY